LYFQFYKLTPEGKKYGNKSLPIVLKSYKPDNKDTSVAICSGLYFGVFTVLEFAKLYAECSSKIRLLLESVMLRY